MAGWGEKSTLYSSSVLAQHRFEGVRVVRFLKRARWTRKKPSDPWRDRSLWVSTWNANAPNGRNMHTEAGLD